MKSVSIVISIWGHAERSSNIEGGTGFLPFFKLILQYFFPFHMVYVVFYLPTFPFGNDLIHIVVCINL